MAKGIPCPKGKDLIQAEPWSKSCQNCVHWAGNPDTGWCACGLMDTDNLAALNESAQREEGRSDRR